MSKVASTGLQLLDEALGGGLPTGRGYMLSGGPFSGVEFLAMQITFNSLLRGEPCIYVSFNKTFRRIVDEFTDLNWDLHPYIKMGTFGVLDFASLRTVSESEIREKLSSHENDIVHFLTDPTDLDTYFEAHVGLREKVGFGGASILDSFSDHLIAAKAAGLSEALIIDHYAKCRQRFGETGGGFGLHLFNKEIKRNQLNTYSELLDHFEDGTIYMERRRLRDNSECNILYGHIKSFGITIPKMSYAITKKGIYLRPLEEYELKELERQMVDEKRDKGDGQHIYIEGDFQGAIAKDVKGDIEQEKFTQSKVDQSINFVAIQKDIDKIKAQLLSTDDSQEKLVALNAIIEAEVATKEKNKAKLLTALKKGGTWLANFAKDVGANIIANILAKQIGS